MLLNMKNDMLILVSNVIILEVLTLLYPVPPGRLVVIYLNLYMKLKSCIEIWIDV